MVSLRFSLALTLLPLLCGADQRCVTCHPAESKTQPATSMARALVPAAQSAIWAKHPDLTAVSGDDHYQIQPQDDRVLFQVADNQQSASVLLQWAFGVGNVGQTFVFMANGQFYESRMSYYKTLNGLALTVGHASIPVNGLKDALARPLSEAEVTNCFGCHATTEGETLTPGIQCAACHANAAEHVASFATKTASPVLPEKLSRLSSLDMANRCGVCHRTFENISQSGPRTIENVRFQPYRLVGSRCFLPNDQRISCVACHNPHQEVEARPESYDTKCQACHQPKSKLAGLRLCPVSTAGCVTCHMPKVDYPEMHYKFTDHRIRVVKANSKYPV